MPINKNVSQAKTTSGATDTPNILFTLLSPKTGQRKSLITEK